MSLAAESFASAPLSGIRVLDFSHVLAGPFCTRLLADLGADVVRVESSKHPDHPWQSIVTRDGRHASYLNTNRSKRSVAIDLKNDTGQTIASRLAAAADVVIENFSAGVMRRLKLDYETLQPLNPALIYVSMSGYGHSGPRRDWTSMNMNLQGYSGLMMVTGEEGDPPTAISNSWNDYIGGLHACFAILQAVDERSITGKGIRIDLSQFECSAAMIGPLLLGSAINGRVPPRPGNRSAIFAPQGVYRCAGTDEWCSLSVQSDEQWTALTQVIEEESWGSDRRFARADGRMRQHDEIDLKIEAWTGRFANTEVERRLKGAGIPAERMRRINDLIGGEDGATAFSRMEEPRLGSTMLTTGLPFSLSSGSLPAPRTAPGLGEHTTEVLGEWLKLSDQEITAIRDQGALI
jgi:crotonobetainyl-CoA:carnitine CoA-transferase CaiB-like acyl-CoA transferase